MCLILFAYNAHPDFRLILAANRDEFYARPSRAAGFWPDAPDILAGRDVQRGGTWLGITRSGRLAAVTNYREPRAVPAVPDQAAARANDICEDAPSRGQLVSDFLKSRGAPLRYLRTVAADSRRYDGFNLLAGDGEELFYYSNRSRGIQRVLPGVHGLSNHLLDTGWPKIRRGVSALRRIALGDGAVEIPALLHLLCDRGQPADDELPDTGVGLDRERLLAPIFIASPDYGTRCSSVLLIDRHGRVTFYEETWQPAQAIPISTGKRCVEWTIPPDSP